MLRALGRVSHVIRRAEEVILAGSILVIACATIGNVFMRTIFDSSLAFAEELSEFLMVLVTFVGLAYATGLGRHIRMTALYDQLGPNAQKRMMLLITSTTSLLMLVLTWHALAYVETVRVLGSVSPVLRVPLFWIYLSAPLGLGLAGVQYALAFFKNLASDKVYLSFSVQDEYDDSVHV